jgi:fatty acid desaturase
MTDTHAARSIPRYRQVLKSTLPAHYFKPDNLHLLWFIPHLALIGGSLWLLWAWFSWWLAPVLALVVGHSFACLGFLAHEICHGGSIRNKRVRHAIAAVAFSPFAIGPYLWSRWHNAAHHSHTQDHDLDPDRLFTLDEYQVSPFLRWLYRISPLARNLVIFSSFSFRMSQHNFNMASAYLKDPISTLRDKAVIVFQFALPLVVWTLGTALLGWQVLLFGFVLPVFIANFIVICYIATNHFLNPLADEADVLATSLSVTLPRGLSWLDPLHSYFGAHVAHHLFPQAPTRYGRSIEREMAKLWPERYHEMPIHHALRLLWNTPWVYNDGGTTFIDPQRGHVAPTLGHGLEQAPR